MSPQNPNRRRDLLRRAIPVAAIVLIVAVFCALDLDRFLGFDALRANRDALEAWVHSHAVVAVITYMAVYAVAMVAFPPSGAFLTITGGFLFGTIAGGLYVVFAATAGATALFLVAKTAFGDPLRARAGPFLKRLEDGFRANALSYLLVLRLIPLFPFWLINLAPAFLGVPLRIYVVGTFFGIIPGTLVYASVGNGLGAILATDGTPDLGIIFEPQFLIPILGLAGLAVLPVIYKKVSART